MSLDTIRPFNEIPISTTTMTVLSNMNIDLEELFELLPVVHVEIPDGLTNKNKIKKLILEKNLPVGTIISIQLKGSSRGVRMSYKSTFFRNNMSIYMVIQNKVMNFKVPIQGKMQITGATRQEQANTCITSFIAHLISLEKKVYNLTSGNNIKLIFKTVMTDIVFTIGFEVNRQKLDQYINQLTNSYESALETSIGSTGVNVKCPFKHENPKMLTLELIDQNRLEWKEGTTTFLEYVDILSATDRKKELNKKRNNTFLVFYSGTTIMSGMIPEYMQDVYYNFNRIIRQARHQVEEVNVV